MAVVSQLSFSRGEISPSLWARADLQQYANSLRTCRNFFVRPTGGVSNRAGTQYLATTRYSDKISVLIPFVYSTVQAYVLEFGHLYIRVYANGVQVGSDVVTPYVEADLTSVRYTQSADVLTLVHSSYPPAEFKRTSSMTFTFTSIAFTNGPFDTANVVDALALQASATTGSVTVTATGGNVFTAAMIGTTIRLDEQNLSAIPPWEASKLLAASGVNPLNLKRRANGKVYRVATNQVAGANGTYTGTIRPSHDEGTQPDGDGNAVGTTATRAGVDWQYLHSGFGTALITAYTSPTQVTATVLDLLPDSVQTGTTNVWSLAAWGAGGYPSVVTYYGDRLVFANSRAHPQTEWASKVGDYHNFGTSSPLVADDSISQTLNARQVNEIRELVPLDQLIALTSNASWASPKRGEVWSAETIGFDPQSNNGAAAMHSVLAGDTALYVSDNSTKVRDLQYSFQIDKFSGNELTVLARHFFTRSKTIVDLDYAEEPHGILWCVRSDGKLIGLTYLREQDVIGWHQHDTDGYFERVCVIPEDGADAVYFIVRRTVNGATVRYLERFAVRDVELLEDLILMDSAISFDGRNTTTTTVTISSTSGFARGANGTVSSTGPVFSGSVPDELRIGSETVEVLSATDNYTLVVKFLADVPAELQDSPTADWGKRYDTFSGMAHNEGQNVVALSDGSVVRDLNVSGGAVTLDDAAEVVHIGRPLTAQIETLDMNLAGAESIRSRSKTVAGFSVVVQDTVGLKVGSSAENVEDVPWREDENYDEPTRMRSEAVACFITNTWSTEGRLVLQQPDPLPVTILAIVPELRLGSLP